MPVDHIDVEKIPKDKKVIFGIMAGMISTTLFHPLDMIKVRLQVYGLPMTSWNMASRICRCEGCAAMYVGLSAGLMRQATYTATRLTVYYWLYDDYKKKHEDVPSLNKKILFGCCAGLAGAFIGNPSEMALVRLLSDGQGDPCGVCHKKRRYNGASDAVFKIAREEGVFALWRGGVLTLSRSLCMSIAQVGTYTKMREYLREHHQAEGTSLHFYTSVISSFFAAFVSLPADVIKTMYQVRSDKKTQWQVVLDLHRKNGIIFFWRGFFPYFMRMALHTFITFFAMGIICEVYKDLTVEKNNGK